ncbi:DUF4382 domain-containing protein [Ramlibacter sp. AW1]|uniref:DUF4382 domain-containing protein n=1 Tax=Ramlibacter aurantiacus TaxID=2801330 RepID=A0A936ZLG1_9BURK|nr:DUF4382 domain-containing protein [Ramlibacter aurantiacus]MBL0421982.1 DUF4382 domain-containing protein [Ramlibacter aurantiacus]
MNLKKPLATLLSAAALAVLSACGGGGDEGGVGTLSLKITDAPVDSASSVNVRFTGVALKPANGPEQVITFDAPRTIDLLALQRGAAASLLEGHPLPAGLYDGMRLLVQAERGVIDSYLTALDGSQRSLFVPSGEQSGLKLTRGFIVPVNGSASFTIDFDLRKSLVDPQNAAEDIYLKPVLRVVDNAQVGTIAGTVGQAALTHASCNTPNRAHAVYVFAGPGVTPDDIDRAGVEPVTTAAVTAGTDGAWSFRAAYLMAGEYTVAFTCQAGADEPETSQTLVFQGTRNVTVAVDGTAQVAF